MRSRSSFHLPNLFTFLSRNCGGKAFTLNRPNGQENDHDRDTDQSGAHAGTVGYSV